LFLTIPVNYKARDIASGYQEYRKDSITEIQIIENIYENFYYLKGEFLKNPSGLNNGDTGTSKAVRVGKYDGLYYTGPFKTADQKSAFLIFGDSSFAVIIAGFFKRTDKVVETELNNFLKTVSYDRSVMLDPLELANFTFDESITGFKYTPDGIGAGSITYSSDGIIKSVEDEHHKSLFRFETYKSGNIEKAKKILHKEIEDFSAYTIKLTNVRHQDLFINGNLAYEVIMTGKGVNIANSIYYIILIQKKERVVQFWSVDRDNGKWIEKFKATAQSIKL